jgi:hypothetical protein
MGFFEWIKVNWKILHDYDNPDASHGLEEGNAVLSITLQANECKNDILILMFLIAMK